MPLYRHNVTGNEFTASEDYVSALPEGAATKVADESPQEKHDRLSQEAVENKVELDFDGDPDAPKKVDPDATVVDASGAAVDPNEVVGSAPAKATSKAPAKSAEK